MDFDLLILGGGPAGLATALHLQRLAPELTSRLLILEKEHYPRPKLCAGGLTADAESLLADLGLDVSEIPHVDAAEARFNFAGQGLTVKLPGSHTLRIIRRDEFDAWLAAKARERGIAIREGVTVKLVIPESDGVLVETDQGTFRAQIVVGADGANGIVRRCVLPNVPVNTARLLEVITGPLRPCGAPPPNANEVQFAFGGGREGGAVFDFRPVPSGIAGYTWDFPTQIHGQPARCWGIYDANLWVGSQRPPLKALLAAEMARAGFNLGEYELKAHPIRWFDPFQHLSVPRVLLVGDAAGADALFGEGISFALGFGKLAAGELAQAFRQEKFDLAGYRRRVWFSPLGQALTARWVLAALIYFIKWKWFQFLLWRVFKPIVLLVAWFLVLNWAKRLR